jgi:hypothetical protein
MGVKHGLSFCRRNMIEFESKVLRVIYMPERKRKIQENGENYIIKYLIICTFYLLQHRDNFTFTFTFNVEMIKLEVQMCGTCGKQKVHTELENLFKRDCSTFYLCSVFFT